MTADVEMLPELVAEGLDFFNLAGDEGDKLYVRAIHQHIAAKDAEIEALRAEVERVTCELMDAITRADKLAEALREWWAAHRPVGWTEDQHRACPYVNLPTDTDKALAEALLRDQEEGQ